MKVCVIGGSNADITATTLQDFVANDSNPGKVRITPGGVARNIAHNLALLGNEVVFLTLFPDDVFGRFTAESCRNAGIDISHCDLALRGKHSCFVSINNRDGEMIGGVSDMMAVDDITPSWLAQKLSKIGPVDVLVADANLPVEALAFLIDITKAPLYMDAVSSAKAGRIKEAMERSKKKHIHTLKCNRLEAATLSDIEGVDRFIVSLGADGIEVHEGQETQRFPALPSEVANATGAGDALMAGLIHAGPEASVKEAARIGLRCAKIAVETPDVVNTNLRQRYAELS